MTLPDWIHGHLNTREPLTHVPGQRTGNWNIARWSPNGLRILDTANDRAIAEQRAAEITERHAEHGDHTKLLIIPGTTQEQHS